AGLLILLGYAATVPTDLTNAPMITLFRFFALAAALHLFAAIAPFTTGGEENGFWHYNKTLFLRVLTAGLYSLVLYLGLVIALVALENLFGVDVPEKRYPELFIFIVGLFSTWFFLAGIPEDLSQLNTLTEYPKGLKIFAQYILFPLVLIYLVILYAYLAKILIEWDWPQGWVSKLILGFSGTGMFSLLLLHPVVGRTENLWIARAARWFYILLIPLVVMLFLAVWRRVSEYGMTEGRYIALGLGVWLVFLIAYFTLSRARSIKIIPASLCVLTFLVSFGPWGMFSVAEQSQIGRLESILAQTGILSEGNVRAVHGEVPIRDTKQISAILSYLHEHHGLDGIQGWFDQSLKVDSKVDSIPSGVAYKSPEAVAKLMGVEYTSRWVESTGGMMTFLPETAYDVSGYDRVIHVNTFGSGISSVDLPADGIAYHMPEGIDTLIFTRMSTGAELLRINILEHAETLLKEHEASPTDRTANNKMRLSAEGNGLRVAVCPWHIQIMTSAGKTKVVRLTAAVLYSVEKAP
ncbi:MAG: hypothetical protein H6Q32_1303, partial [Bacteroidetes bacterium]|nr:hypothetical protein [Bacteroidota bacterium]